MVKGVWLVVIKGALYVVVKGACLVDGTRLNNRRPIYLLEEGVYTYTGFALGRRGQLCMTNGCMTGAKSMGRGQRGVACSG